MNNQNRVRACDRASSVKSRLRAAAVNRASRRAAMLLFLLLPTAVAVHAGTNNWIGINGTHQWNVADYWSLNVIPGAADDAINATNSDIIHSAGSDIINSFLSSGMGAFSLTGGSITANQPGTSTFQVNGVFSLNGGTLSGFVLNGGSPLLVSGSSSNFLDNTTSNIALDLSGGGLLRISNGLTLNNTATLAGSSTMVLQGDQTLGGTGAVSFSDNNTGYLRIDGNTTLTLGSSFLVHGINGVVGGAQFVGGTGNLVNNGTIASDGGGTITIVNNGTFTNDGTVRATNNSTLRLQATTTNAAGVIADSGSSLILSAGVTQTGGGTFTINNGGNLTFSGGSLSGGVLNSAGTVAFTSSSGNILSGVTATLNAVDLTGGGLARIFSGTTNLNGIATLAGSGTLVFQGDQTLDGTGAVLFSDTNTNYIRIDGNTTLTLGGNMLVHGVNGVLGGAQFVGGTENIVNNGTISSDGGGTITIVNNGTFTNNNLIEARSGSTLTLNESVSNAAAGVVRVADATSRVIQNGVTVSGGTIAIASGGDFLVTSGGNVLDGVIVNGNLDLLSGGVERIGNGLTNNGVATVGGNGLIAFYGDQTLGGTGSILFADTNTSNRVSLEGNTTLTLGSGQTIHGINGAIGAAQFLGGTGNLINNGTIASDGGGTITVNNSGTLTNNSSVRAASGSTLRLNGTIVNTATVLAGSGSVVVLSGAATQTGSGVFTVNSGGNLTFSGGSLSDGALNSAGTVAFTSSGGNILSGVTATLNAVDLTGGGVVRVFSGTTNLNGIATIGGNGLLAFQGDQTLDGTGAVLFADTNSSNRLSLEGTTTLTIGSNILVHGINGAIGPAQFVGGTGNLTNNGTISSDGGGTIAISNNGTFTNSHLIEARNGSALTLNQSVANTGGTIAVADATSRVTQNGIAISGGTITVAAGGDFAVTSSGSNTLAGATVNGNLDLLGGGAERVGGGLTNNGVLGIGGNGLLAFFGDQGLGGDGAVLFADTNTSNRLSLEGNTTLTIGGGQTVHGINGAIGAAQLVGGTGNLINNGTISSDGGGTITLNNNGTVLNAGTFSSAVGSVLRSNQNVTQTSGRTVADGTITIGSGGTLAISGGTLEGTGTLNANVANSGGSISAGSTTTAGTLAIVGDLSESATSLLIVNLGGALQGTDYDFLDISGVAALDGTVNVSLIAGFTPTVGQTFDIARFSSETGTIAQVTSANPGYNYHVSYQPSQATQPTVLRLTVDSISSSDALPESGSLLLFLLGAAPMVGIVTARCRHHKL